MSKRFDIAAYSRDGELQLIVEVKASRGASDEWGVIFRRNLLAHGLVPPSKFFLLALPNNMYLWRDNVSPEATPADYKAKTGDVLKPYLADLTLGDMSEQGLEILMTAWLRDLIGSDLTEKSAGTELKWLFDSGLFESIRRGSLTTQNAA